MTKTLKSTQDPAELKAMAVFYGNQYDEVYFVRCLQGDHIIAVECAPAIEGAATQERATGQRNIFGYQDLFFTSRVRLDVNESNQRMIGYECRCRNDTRMSNHERGVVPTRTVKRSRLTDKVVEDTGPVRNLSPFEQAQLQSTVKLSQAVAKVKADYESYVDKEGHIVERFETFEVVRMK